MKEFVIENEIKLKDIAPLFCGSEECAPQHSFGPFVRDYYLIHFCLSGKGVLRDKFGTHKICGGELFIIRPGERTVYTADKDEPWHYIWIAFVGEAAEKFNTERSVYPFPLEAAERLNALIRAEERSALIYSSVILELMHSLFAAKKKSKNKLSEIKAYIDYNYMNDISVDFLSKIFAFERSYIFRMFKKNYGVGVKEYIINVKMEHAKQFLEEGHTVANTAYMIGYSDEFNFSRAFKKHVGLPPSEYKKELSK